MENSRRGQKDALAFVAGLADGGSNDARVSLRPRRRELPAGGGNTLRKLMRREIGGLSGRPPPRPDATFFAEKFLRRFKLQAEFRLQGDFEVTPLLSMRRSITQIIPANDFVFVIDFSGYCIAFHHTANASVAPYKMNGYIRYFNSYNEEMVTLFYNKINDSIITVCSPRTARVRGYTMRAISLEKIRRCDDLGHGTPVFRWWTDNFPIFDDCNNLAIISSFDQERHLVNNIYETKNYKLVHFIHGQIHSMATRPGIMIVAYELIHNCLPIQVFSTKNWTVLKEFSYSMPPRQRLQFVGLCHENLLLQENGQKMQIIDIWNNNNVTTVERSENRIFVSSCNLNATDALLIFENEMVVTCNSRGVQVPLLEGTGNEPSYFTFQIDVTRDKNFAILYSNKFIENPAEGIAIDNRQVSSIIRPINICSTFNGKSILKVNPWDDPDLKTTAASMDNDNHRTNDEQGSTHEALKNVMSIFYDEEHHRIYTGNRNGSVNVWSN